MPEAGPLGLQGHSLGFLRLGLGLGLRLRFRKQLLFLSIHLAGVGGKHQGRAPPPTPQVPLRANLPVPACVPSWTIYHVLLPSHQKRD